MRTRIIGPEEWGRLGQTDLPTLLPYVKPQNITVSVVEDEAQKIVGCLSALQVTCLEGLWIAPEHRKHGAVARSLLRQAVAVPRAHGECWALGCLSVESDERMGDYLRRLGGREMRSSLYILPVGRA